MDDNTGLNKVTRLKWLLLSGLQVARALALCPPLPASPPKRGGGSWCVRGKKGHIYMLSVSPRDNKPIERNAVEWEEGEKIGGFCFLGFFFPPVLRRINPAAIGMFSAQPIG